jgi:hypothetical protein
VPAFSGKKAEYGKQESGVRIATGSAGISPAKFYESMQLSFFILAGETPALPAAILYSFL